MKVGDKVRFINESKHRDCPVFYPRVGTVGTVSDFPRGFQFDENDKGDIYICVQWPSGTTACNSRWWCTPRDVELVEEDEE